MRRIYSSLVTEHDPKLLVLVAGLCLFASLTSLVLAQRGRAAVPEKRTQWLVSAGVVTGISIWVTHFAAMLAYQPGVEVRFDGRDGDPIGRAGMRHRYPGLDDSVPQLSFAANGGRPSRWPRAGALPLLRHGSSAGGWRGHLRQGPDSFLHRRWVSALRCLRPPSRDALPFPATGCSGARAGIRHSRLALRRHVGGLHRAPPRER